MWRPCPLSLFLTAPAWCYPKILVRILTCRSRLNCTNRHGSVIKACKQTHAGQTKNIAYRETQLNGAIILTPFKSTQRPGNSTPLVPFPPGFMFCVWRRRHSLELSLFFVLHRSIELHCTRSCFALHLSKCDSMDPSQTAVAAAGPTSALRQDCFAATK